MKSLDVSLYDIELIRKCLFQKLDYLQDQLCENEYLLSNETDVLKSRSYTILCNNYRKEIEIVLLLLEKLEVSYE